MECIERQDWDALRAQLVQRRDRSNLPVAVDSTDAGAPVIMEDEVVGLRGRRR